MSDRTLAGRYRLSRHIGSGGMASVHEAIDHTLERDVAVKLMHPQFGSDATFLERFRREARAAAALNHPNIVTVHDTGDDHGTPFIVMEYVRGVPLEDVLADVATDRAVDIVAQVSAALAFAHDRGVVHRDVKPANILLADDGSVKVTDFGIARAAGTDTITMTSVLGTAAYLSPEQARGDEVDGRSDIYSLGIVLYELLTGHPPFRGGSPVQVALRHIAESPPRPSELAEVDRDLEAIVLTALAKEPDDRYRDAGALRDDLLAYRAGRPVTADLEQAVAASGGIREEGPATVRVAPVDRDTDRSTVAIGDVDDTVVASPAPEDAVPTPTEAAPSSAPDPTRANGHGTRRRWLRAVALVAVAAAAIAALVVVDGDQVTVPQVKGMPREEAVTAILESGLTIEEIHERPHDSIPAGTVLASRPFGGQRVKEGAGVTIAVSTGPG